tara:strand:- start:134 stop:466 length:333 start_codon:yes stop_codon:yes gene_type:complete
MSYGNVALLIGCLSILLLGFMAAVNAFSPPPTREYVENRVTRYHHYHPNPADKTKPLAQAAMLLMDGYKLLFEGLGFFVYQILNIAFYAVIWPACMILLSFWALGPVRKN